MTRRTFTQAIAAWFAVPLAVIASKPGTYGLMTLDRWNREGMRDLGARVFLDGTEITNDCTQFDDREGWADVWLRNVEGRHYMRPDQSGAAQGRRYGRIVVTLPA